MPSVPNEVILEQYQLRSTFFAEKLNELGFFGFEGKISKIIEDQGDLFVWDSRSDWGISEDAWRLVASKGLHPLSVFCHPRIVNHHPALIRYYRSVSLLPQKGMQKIAKVYNIKSVEAGEATVSLNNSNNVVCRLNELVSAIVLLTPDLDSERIKGMMFATAGTTIDGSWRNQIGLEGERVIRSLLVKALQDNEEIRAVVNKDDVSFTVIEWRAKYGDLLASLKKIKSVVTTNGTSMLFSSEPDVTLSNAEGSVVGAIEIKAGIDPAAALERLGAMFKSFDNVLSSAPDATTILVATCLTREVESRLRESNAVTQTFLTTDVINNKSGRGVKFSNSARAVLGLIERRM